MSRNGNGVYSAVNSVLTAPYLSDQQIQSELADLSQEITNSSRNTQVADLAGLGTAVSSAVTINGVAGTQYTLTLTTPWNLLPVGIPLSFRVDKANAGPTQIVVNSIGPYPLRLVSGVELPQGTLIPGSVYMAGLNLASFAPAGITGNLAYNQTSVSSVSNTAGMTPGMTISSSVPGIPAGTYITAVTSGSLTMSAPFTPATGAGSTGAPLTITGAEVIITSVPSDNTGVLVQASTPAAGTTQATATPITADMIEVTTAGTGALGVLLPTRAGATVTVINATASTINVYPPVNGTITTGATTSAVNTPYALAANSIRMLYSAAAGRWYT